MTKLGRLHICDGGSFFISREGQEHGVLLWEDVQRELPVCSEGKDESWDVEKGEVENKVQECNLGLSSS